MLPTHTASSTSPSSSCLPAVSWSCKGDDGAWGSSMLEATTFSTLETTSCFTRGLACGVNAEREHVRAGCEQGMGVSVALGAAAVGAG